MLRSDAWDPLFGGLGIAAVVAAAFGLALVARSWWVLAGGLVVMPLFGERVLENDPLGVMFTLIFLTPAVIALLALATAVAKAAPAPRGRAFGIGAFAVSGALTVAGLYLDWRVVDESPSDPLTVNAERGTWRGLRIGSTKAEVRRLVGAPPSTEDREGSSAPLGMSDGDLDGPSSHPAWETWRYEGFALFFAKQRLQGFVTVSDRSETREGVGVGDSLEIARRRYRGLDCDELTYGEATLPDLAYCAALFDENRQIFFAGDPIHAIWVYRDASLAGSARLAVR